MTLIRNIKRLLNENQVSFRDKWKWLQYNRMLRKSSKDSIHHFLQVLARGDEALEKEYHNLNPHSSQPLKPGIS